jgi:hypothetical protein
MLSAGDSPVETQDLPLRELADVKRRHYPFPDDICTFCRKCISRRDVE